MGSLSWNTAHSTLSQRVTAWGTLLQRCPISIFWYLTYPSRPNSKLSKIQYLIQKKTKFHLSEFSEDIHFKWPWQFTRSFPNYGHIWRQNWAIQGGKNERYLINELLGGWVGSRLRYGNRYGEMEVPCPMNSCGVALIATGISYPSWSKRLWTATWLV